MLQITHITVAGHATRARRLVFEDQTERTTSSAVLKLLELDVGSHTTEESLSEAEYECARERALRIIGHRERSTSELSSLLLADGYPQHIAHRVTDRMAELALVDDERFTRIWVDSRCASGFGRRRIERELAERGIDPELITSAFEEAGGDDELERALAALGKRTAADAKERERLLRRLISKGYSFDVAKRAVAQVRTDRAESAD